MQSFLHHSEFTDLVSAQEHDAQGTGVISDGTVYLSQQKTHGSGSYARNLNLADHEMHPPRHKGDPGRHYTGQPLLPGGCTDSLDVRLALGNELLC